MNNKRFSPIIGEIGENRDVPIDQLMIDRDYQRPPGSDRYIFKIAADWNWDLVGRLCVADRNGTLFVVDGQQRMLAAMRRGDINTLPCVIRKSPGKPYEAMLFRDLNTGSKKPRLVQSYKAGLRGGNQFCVDIENFIAPRGFKIGEDDAPNVIQCIGKIEKLYNQRKETLFKALSLCMTISENRFRITKDLLEGMYTIISHNVTLDDVAIRKLQAAGEVQIKQSIDNQKIAFGTQGGLAQASGIIRIANQKRPAKNRVSL